VLSAARKERKGRVDPVLKPKKERERSSGFPPSSFIGCYHVPGDRARGRKKEEKGAWLHDLRRKEKKKKEGRGRRTPLRIALTGGDLPLFLLSS